MNRAPAHLEWKLRFFELSVGQIAVVVIGAVIAYAWARYVSPLHGLWGAASAVYVCGLFAVPVVIASQSDLDVAALAAGAVRWRRVEARFAPDEVQGDASGYVVTPTKSGSRADVGAGMGVDLWLWSDQEEDGRCR